MKERSFRQKIWFTLGAALLFLFGRSMPIPWVESERAAESVYDLTTYARMTLGSEQSAVSFFALGFSPYISASIIMMFFGISLRQKKNRMSPEVLKKATIVLAFLIGIFQAVMLLGRTTYLPVAGVSVMTLHVMTGVTLLIGSGVMISLMNQVREKGAGGSQALICVNILRGMATSLIRAIQEMGG